MLRYHQPQELQLGSRFTAELPGDPSEANVPRQVHGALWSRVSPTPTSGGTPRTVAYSADVARQIGLDPAECERPEFALCFSGNATLPTGGGVAFAQCYGGHQFGNVGMDLMYADN